LTVIHGLSSTVTNLYSLLSFLLFLVIETAPKINLDILQREYKVKRGEDITIEVKYSSTPTPNDEWFIDGKLVKKSKRVRTLLFIDFKS
jgi:hypothetical protein